MRMGEQASALLRDVPGRSGAPLSNTMSMPNPTAHHHQQPVPQLTERQLKQQQLESEKQRLTAKIAELNRRFEETGDSSISKEIRRDKNQLGEVKRQLHELQQLPPEPIPEEDEQAEYSKTFHRPNKIILFLSSTPLYLHKS